MIKKLALIPFLLLAACDSKTPGQKAYDYFVELCQEDVEKAKNFDCTCQADAVDYELNDAEMVALVNFLMLTKEKDPAAAEEKKKPEFETAHQKLVSISGRVQEKCAIAKAE